MAHSGQPPKIRVRKKDVHLVSEKREALHRLFGVCLDRSSVLDESEESVSAIEDAWEYLTIRKTDGTETVSSKLTSKVQSFVDAAWGLAPVSTLASLSSPADASEDVFGEGIEESLPPARRKLESEDSSYDSDNECNPGQGHGDVSRTVSDTLGAEYADYVSAGDTLLENEPQYATRVEFGVKLGYSERLVRLALQKLGPSPGQNELLAELIRLGAQLKPQDTDATDEFCEAVTIHPFTDVETSGDDSSNLRAVVIDGSNVAMSHGNKETFSCRGIKICVDWFRARGHREITVFVPRWRKEAPRPDTPITDQDILLELEKERLLVFTPSRLVGGKRLVCYDDRYVLRLAAETDGIVVSNDNYRDLAAENPEFRKVVEERILMYSFVNDRFMPPDDPLGRSGPTLDNFLRRQPRGLEPPPPCPYAKKCTYGNKCKYGHPERGPLPQKSVAERLAESAQRQLQEVKARGGRSRDPSPGEPLRGKSLSLPLQPSDHEGSAAARKTPLARTKSTIPGMTMSTREDLPADLVKPCDRIPRGPYRGQWCARNAGAVPSGPLLMGDQSGHVAVAKRLSDPESGDGSGAKNLHRKLQRQLTLNPSYDPRLFAMQGALHPHGPPPGPETLHPHVTRIASAPDSVRSWPPPPPRPPMQRLSSSSDPQLNLYDWPPPVQNPGASPVWPPQMSTPPPLFTTTEDARRRLFYHLAALFPAEQVHTAMALCPEETNPQKICAAILGLFSKTN